MELVLAMDLKEGLVVHGKRGERASYRPLTWGLSHTAEPQAYLEVLHPRYLYIADLDRISGSGSHDQQILACARKVERCYVDRGCRSPPDLLQAGNVVNVIGTETAGDLSRYEGGMLSLDIREGRVIPGNRKPLDVLREAEHLAFDTCLILDIGAVGTEAGLSPATLGMFRDACSKRIFYGGGIRDMRDLANLASAGFDGAVLATAVHNGAVPAALLTEGHCARDD